jgi:hypothetical protein
VVVGALPTGSGTACNRQVPKSEVGHDHIRPRQHQIGAIACIGVHIRPGHVKHVGTTKGGETVGGSSRSGEFSSRGRSAKVIGDGCSDASGKVLLKGVDQNLLPSAQAL